MAGLMLNGSMIQGLVYNGNPVSAMFNGQWVWPTAEPTPVYPTYEKAILKIYKTTDNDPAVIMNMKINGESISCPAVLYSGKRYGWGDWTNVDNGVLDNCCKNTSPLGQIQGTEINLCFSGFPSSGWQSISWESYQYYQPTGNITAEMWGSANNFQRCMGSGTFTMSPGQTYNINLA